MTFSRLVALRSRHCRLLPKTTRRIQSNAPTVIKRSTVLLAKTSTSTGLGKLRDWRDYSKRRKTAIDGWGLTRQSYWRSDGSLRGPIRRTKLAKSTERERRNDVVKYR